MFKAQGLTFNIKEKKSDLGKKWSYLLFTSICSMENVPLRTHSYHNYYSHRVHKLLDAVGGEAIISIVINKFK
jgi:hypothetical protein